MVEAVGLDPLELAAEEEALLGDVEAQRPGQPPLSRPQYLKVGPGRGGVCELVLRRCSESAVQTCSV